MSIVKRNIPNLFTAGNLVGGIIAIILALEGRVDLAPFPILISAVLDFLDGFIARLLKVQSELGKQMDSLADMVTFGVAPGIIMFQLIKSSYIMDYYEAATFEDYINFFPISTEGLCSYVGLFPIPDESVCNNPYFFVAPYVALIIPVFALFRLAKFNLDDNQKTGFLGLPTPAATLFFASLPLLISLGFRAESGWQNIIAHDVILNDKFLVVSSIVFSLLMVIPIPLFALKFKTFGFKGNEIRYIFLTISLALLATLFWWALPIIIVLYIILSLINNLISKSATDEI